MSGKTSIHKKLGGKLLKEYQRLKGKIKSFAGYPVNADFDYTGFYHFLKLPINNVGDPFASSNYQLNSHQFEQEVITYVAGLYQKTSGFWGYVTNGGTEGNLCGLHIARNLYPNAKVYHSDQAHYSIPKAIEITRSIPVILPSLDNGELDYQAFAKQLAEHPVESVIVMANYGTTMTGAIDDVKQIKQIIEEAGIKDYYIHADAALHGMIVPFVDSDKNISLDDVSSLSISGHKLIGCPLPCGMFLAHQSIIDTQQSFVEYVEINDSTITGSRNALSPLMLWYALFERESKKEKKHTWFFQAANRCLANADYCIEQLNRHGINAWRNPASPIVVIPRPNNEVVKKWQLAVQNDIAHIVVMPHVNKRMISKVVRDMVTNRR